MTDALKRAVRSFLQAAVAIVVASGSGFTDIAVWKGAAVAGGVALFSYIQNALEDRGVVPTVLK